MGDIFDTETAKQEFAKTAEKLRTRQASDLAKVIDLPEGRRVLWRILMECRYDDSPFSQNALVMGNLAGRREVGMFIRREVKKLSLARLQEMEREAETDNLLRAVERRKIEEGQVE